MAPSDQVLQAFFPSRQTETAMMATTAGLIPNSQGATWGSCPKWTYIQARPAVKLTAGRMKQIPATARPLQPALT